MRYTVLVENEGLWHTSVLVLRWWNCGRITLKRSFEYERGGVQRGGQRRRRVRYGGGGLSIQKVCPINANLNTCGLFTVVSVPTFARGWFCFPKKDDNLGCVKVNRVTCVRGRAGGCVSMPGGGGKGRRPGRTLILN